MIVSRFLPLAKVAIRRDFLFGRRWSWMKTAVMGEKSDAVRILVKVWKSLLLPRSEFTFLDTYLGPGCGSIPSSFRFLTHSTDRRRDAVASVHLPFSLARWRASSLSLRVLRRGRTWWQACSRLVPLLCHGGGVVWGRSLSLRTPPTSPPWLACASSPRCSSPPPSDGCWPSACGPASSASPSRGSRCSGT